MPRLLLPKLDWNKVKGPMAATIATLDMVGWRPVAADRWIDHTGEQFAVLGSHGAAGDEGIRRAFAARATEVSWIGAAAHWLGGGLESGVPRLAPAKKLRARLAKEGQGEDVALLDMVVCGGLWVADRGGNCRVCPCGLRAPDAFHRYYTCPLIKDIDLPDVTKSNWLIDVLEKPDFRKLECLWGRAILPACIWNKAAKAPDIDEVVVMKAGDFAGIAVRTGDLYTDGSGLWPAQPWAKAGSGAAALSHHVENGRVIIDEIAVVGSAVPGRQTVPRAEAWACAMSAKLLPPATRCTVRPDATYVMKNAVNDAKHRGGVNYDIWDHFDEVVRDGGHDIGVAKVSAHAHLSDLVGKKASLVDFLGNALADAVAGALALDAAAGDPNIGPLEDWEARTTLIAKRLVALEKYYAEWHGPRTLELPPELPAHRRVDVAATVGMLQDRVEQMGHQLVRRAGGVLHCTRCRRRKQGRHFGAWLSTPCTAAPHATAEAFLPARAESQSSALDALAGAEPQNGEVEAREYRRIMKKRKAEVLARAKADREAMAKAGMAAADRAAFAKPWAVPVVEVGAWPVPFAVGDGHDLICCGGYIGCLRCGSVAGRSVTDKLLATCAGSCPEGSKGPISKLAKGKLPRIKRGHQGTEWPDGSSEPRPYKPVLRA